MGGEIQQQVKTCRLLPGEFSSSSALESSVIGLMADEPQ